MKKRRFVVLALAVMACAFMTSCFKGERCTCDGVDLGYVDNCYTACFGKSLD